MDTQKRPSQLLGTAAMAMVATPGTAAMTQAMVATPGTAATAQAMVATLVTAATAQGMVATLAQLAIIQSVFRHPMTRLARLPFRPEIVSHSPTTTSHQLISPTLYRV